MMGPKLPIGNVKVEADPDDPGVMKVSFTYTPIYPVTHFTAAFKLPPNCEVESHPGFGKPLLDCDEPVCRVRKILDE